MGKIEYGEARGFEEYSHDFKRKRRRRRKQKESESIRGKEGMKDLAKPSLRAPHRKQGREIDEGLQTQARGKTSTRVRTTIRFHQEGLWGKRLALKSCLGGGGTATEGSLGLIHFPIKT